MARVASRRAAGLLLALASLPGAAKDTLSVEYFDIQGSTARELRMELSRLGPVADNGIRGDAYTRWRIAWQFDLTERGKSCIAGNLAVDLTVTMFLPRWVPPPDASAELIALWDQYSAAVRFHEDGHHRIAVAAGQEVSRRLNAEPRGQGCKALENRLKAVVDEVLVEYKGKQAAYDRETDSGRAQGTRIL
jgi:predicted secreted Zn-dependent protease